MFRRKQKQESWLPAVPPEDTVNNRDEVIETYRSLDLPKEHTILMGSGAVAMFRFIDGTPLPRRAHDLDILLHPELANELVATKALPSGIRIAEAPEHTDNNPHLIVDSSPLTSELLTGYSALDGSPFGRYWSNIQLIDGIPILSPIVISNRKNQRFQVDGEGVELKKRLDEYDKDLLDERRKQLGRWE